MRRLVALPFAKSFQMAYQSIRVRFFRSLVTTMSLVLAVAFLTFTQAGNKITTSLVLSQDPAFLPVLSKIGYDVNPATADSTSTDNIGSSAKQRWIVFLSLLVCVVGIINAQLMSVTERFREIGTLKCLGALDRFIVRIFVMEATMQGLAGGIVGALLGALVACSESLFSFGLSSLAYMPWRAIGTIVLYAIGTGTGLSLLGVLYPAIVASRMLPVDAMRVEQ
ncbi:FtsX-like permease family protein [Desulfopila sp. IMCC35006]|uniref:ABC transporter permease n=1 Tax=Desulfopila sp. IMCC35006 TaxID=2569542 RepID=UPI0010ABA113|nr:FtsX-like permease family protein [Desulfopila sp. IMCC35006]TKB23821.1 FtsX-like permease family protein [Desulfopila sp. IMCC35006]